MHDRQREIRRLISEFELSNNLFSLAQAQILIQEILDSEGFPLVKYKKWLQK
jgi:hypothetical protein